ncbi:MAG: MerR family transcriptional regulator [Desulfovibrio sp.]|nr:MerR family transcriptional regulator [Desulfovibrio sp.]
MSRDNGDELYSIADIARHFALPESTCRYYCKRFHAYIPSVGEGRRRRYRKATIDVIQAILDEMKKSRTANAVEDALAIRFPRNAVMLQDNSQIDQRKNSMNCEPSQEERFFPPLVLAFMERQTMALEGIAKMLNHLTAHLSHSAIPDTNKTSLDHLEKEVAKLALLLDASEKNQQADLEQLRTWMGRLLRRTGQPA